MHELPVLHPAAAPRPERADAARNRSRILAAAARLVDERGIDHVSMDDVAREACVGTGTLYRRFGDRAGLAFALLEQHAVDFQNALISGPPPLGPGAPPAERLKAFGDGFLELLDRHAELLAASVRVAPAPSGPDELYSTHLAILLRAAAPHLDADFTARALLATLQPREHLCARDQLGWPLERLRAGWHALIDAVTAVPR